jgi:predicted TIM-barrel fold metal-dependent hydrolase
MPDEQTPDAVEHWRHGMTQLAAHPNVCVKLSGLGTFTRRCALQEWQAIVEPTVDTFGPGRSMWSEA